MRRIILNFFILAIISSCQDFPLVPNDQKNIVFFENLIIPKQYDGVLRISTFNIKLGFCKKCDPFSGDIGGDYKHLDRIVEFVTDMDLDLVAFQEVGYNYNTSIIENQIEYIAERTGMNYAFGLGRAVQTSDNLLLNGFIGNAVLSKYTIKEVKNPAIRFIDYYNQNHALKVKVELDKSEEIILINSHLESGSTNDEKELQLMEILQISNENDEPTLIAGDFNINYTPDNSFLSILDENFANSLEEITLGEQNNILNMGTFISGSTIDYIFTSHNDFSVDSAFLAPLRYRDISDHIPYIVEVRVN